MADELFKVDQQDLKKLLEFYQRAPRKFAKASAYMLNDFAFGTRHTAIEVIRELMIVRNPTFVNRQMRAEKTSPTLPIERQQSFAGSLPTKRFSGWREQQLGQPTARERTVNLLARGGTEKRQLKRTMRLRKGADFESYHKYPGQGVEQRNIVMMQHLDRRRWRKPFLVLGKRGMAPGLYKFIRRKPRLLQLFDPRDPQPKPISWLLEARRRYFQREDIGRLWNRTIRRILKFQ